MTDLSKMDTIFKDLYNIINEQQQLITDIAERLSKYESFGDDGTGTSPGGGNATIMDYKSNVVYPRNTLLVDTGTETVYRVCSLQPYRSISVEQDCIDGNLKLVGFESQIVTFNGNPTQSQINVLPEDTLVAIYSAADTPYQPDSYE